uniref:FkbM family methyltransferase n=1 Tax=Succinivibrio sp. TaxID=2053619 RepID=UPI00402AA4AB
MVYKNNFEPPRDVLKAQLIDRLGKVYLSMKSSNIVIWGTGAYGKWLLSFLTLLGINKKVCCFCDSFHDDSNLDYIENIPVFSPSKSASLFHSATFIIASDYYEEILNSISKSPYSDIDTFVLDHDNKMLEKQLIYYTNPPDPIRVVGFNYTWFHVYDEADKSKKLKKMLDYTDANLADQESRDIIHNRCKTFLTGDLSYIDKNEINSHSYFSQDFYPISSDEVLFDCGAFTGDTIEDFVTFTNKKYKKIVAFEPDEKNVKRLNAFINNKIENVVVIQKATGDKNGKVAFLNNGNMFSKTVDVKDSSDELSVDIVRLDNYIDYHPTLIKMDIEGAELDSLIGATQIIKTLKPKLAICIYHMPFDFYEIPKFLKSLVPEYKFKVRQHESGFCETVLYAYI